MGTFLRYIVVGSQRSEIYSISGDGKIVGQLIRSGEPPGACIPVGIPRDLEVRDQCYG